MKVQYLLGRDHSYSPDKPLEDHLYIFPYEDDEVSELPDKRDQLVDSEVVSSVFHIEVETDSEGIEGINGLHLDQWLRATHPELIHRTVFSAPEYPDLPEVDFTVVRLVESYLPERTEMVEDENINDVDVDDLDDGQDDLNFIYEY